MARDSRVPPHRQGRGQLDSSSSSLVHGSSDHRHSHSLRGCQQQQERRQHGSDRFSGSGRRSPEPQRPRVRAHRGASRHHIIHRGQGSLGPSTSRVRFPGFERAKLTRVRFRLQVRKKSREERKSPAKDEKDSKKPAATSGKKEELNFSLDDDASDVIPSGRQNNFSM